MKNIVVKEPQLNSENFEKTIWETLLAVKAGTLKPAIANSVAALARARISHQKHKVDVYKLIGKTPPQKMLE